MPVFHYTSPALAPLILSTGLRMSTQGQGDGGVYFSTLSPASYGLGTPDYEENLISDCFGKERVKEYLGKHKLDLVLVYGIDPELLQQAPGGRVNAKMVSKKTFETLSLPDADGNFFLRPDCLFGCAVADPHAMGFMAAEGRSLSLEEHAAATERLTLERGADLASRLVIERAHRRNEANDQAVGLLTAHVASPSPFPRPLSESLGDHEYHREQQDSSASGSGSGSSSSSSSLSLWSASSSASNSSPSSSLRSARGARSKGGGGASSSTNENRVGIRRLPERKQHGVKFDDQPEGVTIDDDDDDDDLEAYPESMLDSVISRASEVEGGTENPFLLQQQRGGRAMTIFSGVINNQDGDDRASNNAGRASTFSSSPPVDGGMRASRSSTLVRPPSAADIDNNAGDEAAAIRASRGGGGGERLSELRPSLARAASSQVRQLKLRQQKQQQQQQQQPAAASVSI